MMKTDAVFLHVHGFCCSSSMLRWIVLSQPGGTVPHNLPSCTATPSCLVVSTGTFLETPAWSVTQKPAEHRTLTLSGLYRLTSQPGPRHQLNRDYPTLEVTASHLTLTVVSAGQRSVTSCFPQAIRYAGLLLVPILTTSEWKGTWHFQASFSWSCLLAA